MDYKKRLMKKIARKVRGYRASRGMTQEEFAKKIKSVQPAIARLESGDANIGINLLVKIHKKTGLKLVLSLQEAKLDESDDYESTNEEIEKGT